MKTNLHPQYHTDTQVTCACGNTFTVGSTQPQIKVDICSNCHPFYTGEQRFVDVQGRVDLFEKRRRAATVAPRSIKPAKTAATKPLNPLSLKEMLQARSASK